MKERSLFDIEDTDQLSDKRPIRILHKPTDIEQSKITNMLNKLTKNEVQNFATPFLTLMNKYRFRYARKDGTTVTPIPIELIEDSQTQNKKVWVEFLGIFYDLQNYTIIFEDMPPKELALWREVVRNRFLIEYEVNKIMGKECFKETGFYYDDVELKKPLSYYFHVICDENEYIDEHGMYQDFGIFIHIECSRMQLMLKRFFSDLINSKGVETLPENANLLTYNGEMLIFSKLPVLDTLYKNGMMGKYYNKLTAATVKKLQKILSLPDFFTTYPDTKQPPLSTTLMVNFYYFFRLFHDTEKIPSRPEEIIRAIANEAFKYNDFTLSICLPYIKGIKKTKISSYDCAHMFATLLFLIAKHSEEGWLSVDGLIMKIRTFDELADERFMLIDPNNFDNLYMRNTYNDNQSINIGNLLKNLSEPLVKSILFALSTFGIIEIAYNEPKSGDASYYDGLQYVRVTELGKYAFNITKSYTPKISEDNEPAFELDDQRLLIKVLKEASPFTPLLTEYANKIMPSLYRVTYDSFLHGCNSYEEVKRKIDMFQQYVCKGKTSVWEQFFKDILERCNPFTVEQTDYTILRLSPDNLSLQRLVLTEPSIKKYVLKAEDYLLLIKTEELRAFKTALRRFGYLL